MKKFKIITLVTIAIFALTSGLMTYAADDDRVETQEMINLVLKPSMPISGSVTALTATGKIIQPFNISKDFSKGATVSLELPKRTTEIEIKLEESK